MLYRLLLHFKILLRCDLVLSHIVYILQMQDAVTTETTELRNGFQFVHRCPAHFRLAYVIKFLSRKHG